jgi:hypothetical protein
MGNVIFISAIIGFSVLFSILVTCYVVGMINLGKELDS